MNKKCRKCDTFLIYVIRKLYINHMEVYINKNPLSKKTAMFINNVYHWIPCSECEPDETDNSAILIAVFIDDMWHTWLYDNDCPYGWNVLERMEAYWKRIKLPEHYIEETDGQ